MPSALETLVKILRLEREQGYNDTAVIGGLSAFSEKWVKDAHQQARKPEHHLLVDELEKLLKNYREVSGKTERHNVVQYMMDRITGRVPPPPEYQVKDTPKEAPPAEERKPPPPEPPFHRETSPRAEPAPPRSKNAPPARSRPEQRPAQQQRQTSAPRSRGGKGGLRQERQMVFDSVDEFGGQRGDYVVTGEMDIPPQPRLARPPRTSRPQLNPEEAADILRGLRAAVTVVKGVGERMRGSFEKLGVYSVNDLLFFLPRRYDDYTQTCSINRLRPEMTTVVIGTVRHTEVIIGRGSRRDFRIVLDDGTGLLNVIFYGQYFLSRYIKIGDQVVCSGQTVVYGSRLQMSNPEWEHLDTDNLHTVGIVPIYSLTEGLKARGLRRLMKNAVEYWADRLPDYVPEATLERTELADLGWALKNIHFPGGQDHLTHARNRLVFEQLLLLQLAILSNRRDWQAVPADPITVEDNFIESFADAVFPYELTGAQRRAIEDVRRDIVKTTPMNRLLQGDVGAGKTAVAAVVMAMAVAGGKQAALMAPTSILAEQHYRNIQSLMMNMPGREQPVVVGLLTGALSTTEREAIYSGLADGSIDIVIGTHAIIQEGVQFKDLGLAIIDEQHRFGVEQRGALRGKGKNPHLLVMTATPIPRTLALTLYADLDLSILDEMPPGRIPIDTRVVEPVARERIYSFVESQLKEGRQAFVVHPLVEQSEKIDARSAVEAFEELQKVFFRHKVGLLHGRMKPAEKEQIMAEFGSGAYDVLVTTSVAEVGVDVPNASVMVIEGANRFGLAQLHQFRGRVGRGGYASYCLLIPDNSTPEAQARLQALEKTTDGFRLAEMDWEMRGPGDLVGTRQSGSAFSRLAEFITPELVQMAQREARSIYEEDPYLTQPEHQLLAQRVQLLQDERADIS